MKPVIVLSIALLAALLVIPASSIYYSWTGGEGCARCHEIRPPYEDWHASTHRGVACKSCHGDSMSLDVKFHAGNLRRLLKHAGGNVPEQVRIKDADVDAIMERCRACHRQEFAQWQAGPHSITYAGIFLDRDHNSKRLLMDDCLRCHGMYFEGAIKELVTPIDITGPWRLTDAAQGRRPVIPCLACHSMHRRGNPMTKPAAKPASPGPAQEVSRPSLAYFDRREMEHVPVSRMSEPAMLEGARRVKMSPDPRQMLCYQCHAPTAGFQVGTGDDRTPIGVHEGLSCLACHQKHAQMTRASCANCHPRLSNCGLDVEKMDTTYLSAASKHNVHFVKCADCHPKGVPKKRETAVAERKAE